VHVHPAEEECLLRSRNVLLILHKVVFTIRAAVWPRGISPDLEQASTRLAVKSMHARLCTHMRCCEDYGSSAMRR
jgi:hypothetical protein